MKIYKELVLFILTGEIDISIDPAEPLPANGTASISIEGCNRYGSTAAPKIILLTSTNLSNEK